MWNCVQLAMLASHAPNKDGCDVLAVSDLREILCRPLYVAADCLLDMLLQTGDQLNRMFNVRFSQQFFSYSLLIYYDQNC